MPLVTSAFPFEFRVRRAGVFNPVPGGEQRCGLRGLGACCCRVPSKLFFIFVFLFIRLCRGLLNIMGNGVSRCLPFVCCLGLFKSGCFRAWSYFQARCVRFSNVLRGAKITSQQRLKIFGFGNIFRAFFQTHIFAARCSMAAQGRSLI